MAAKSGVLHSLRHDQPDPLAPAGAGLAPSTIPGGALSAAGRDHTAAADKPGRPAVAMDGRARVTRNESELTLSQCLSKLVLNDNLPTSRLHCDFDSGTWHAQENHAGWHRSRGNAFFCEACGSTSTNCVALHAWRDVPVEQRRTARAPWAAMLTRGREAQARASPDTVLPSPSLLRPRCIPPPPRRHAAALLRSKPGVESAACRRDLVGAHRRVSLQRRGALQRGATTRCCDQGGRAALDETFVRCAVEFTVRHPFVAARVAARGSSPLLHPAAVASAQPRGMSPPARCPFPSSLTRPAPPPRRRHSSPAARRPPPPTTAAGRSEVTAPHPHHTPHPLPLPPPPPSPHPPRRRRPAAYS